MQPKPYAWLHDRLLQLPGAAHDYKAEWGWDRYQVGGKLFAAICCPGMEHAAAYAGHPLVNLKCDPLESEALRSTYPAILPGFYCDKQRWIAVLLDGDVPRDLLWRLCEQSYALVFDKLTKKCQREIMAQADGICQAPQNSV